MQKLQALILKIVLFLIAGFFVYQIFIKDSDSSIKEAELKAKTEDAMSYENKKASSTPSVKLTQSQIDGMVSLEEKGFIVFEISLNRVYIKPALWTEMDYKLKEDMTVSFAIYCAMKKGSDTIYIDVYDKQSGKKIAKYSQLWGYEVL